MLKLSNVKSIQLEISRYCNASCPQCPRNYFGGETIPTLSLRKWTTTEFKKIFTNFILLHQSLIQHYEPLKLEVTP